MPKNDSKILHFLAYIKKKLYLCSQMLQRHKTMKKMVFLFTLLLAAVLYVSAVEQNVVAVYQLDGQKALFAFADQPEVTYTATDLVLTTTKTSVQYPIAQLKKLQFETADIEEGIEDVPVEDKRFSFRDGSIVIEGGEPNSLTRYPVRWLPNTGSMATAMRSSRRRD